LLDEQLAAAARARDLQEARLVADLDALEIGADRSAFIVFRNSSTDTINVLFRRPDGNLGLIEPEA